MMMSEEEKGQEDYRRQATSIAGFNIPVFSEFGL